MVRPAIPLTATCLLLLAVGAGCRPRPAGDEASIQKSLQEKGTLDVMDQVSKAPDYQAPADGRLTDGQVTMYLAVREREQKIREVAFKNLRAKSDQAQQEKRQVGFFEAMKAAGDFADVATADLRAAQELGYNPKEYRWVRDRVLEAQMLATTKSLNQQVGQGRQSLVSALEEQKQRTTDEAQRADLDKQIQDLRSDSEAAPDSDPAKELNVRLLAKYQDELARLRSEDQRIAAELQKSGSRGGPQGGQFGGR
jgi:hypothetical protein